MSTVTVMEAPALMQDALIECHTKSHRFTGSDVVTDATARAIAQRWADRGAALMALATVGCADSADLMREAESVIVSLDLADTSNVMTLIMLKVWALTTSRQS